jgi:hypothetical protein
VQRCVFKSARIDGEVREDKGPCLATADHTLCSSNSLSAAAAIPQASPTMCLAALLLTHGDNVLQVVVTGAGGRTGGLVVQQLLQQADKYEVIATVRNEQVRREAAECLDTVGTWWEGQQQFPAGHIARWLFCAAQQTLPFCLPSSLPLGCMGQCIGIQQPLRSAYTPMPL